MSPSPRKVILKITLALKQWLVCTIFSATIFLHLRIHSLKNYSLIFIHAFTLISSIILLTNTLRMKNQSFRLTPQYLHFILRTQLFFKTFSFFYATARFLSQRRHRTYKRAAGRERPTTRKRARGPRLSRSRPRRRAPPTAPAFSGAVQAGNSRNHC